MQSIILDVDTLPPPQSNRKCGLAHDFKNIRLSCIVQKFVLNWINLNWQSAQIVDVGMRNLVGLSRVQELHCIELKCSPGPEFCREPESVLGGEGSISNPVSSVKICLLDFTHFN